MFTIRTVHFDCFSSSAMKLHISPRNQSITKPKIGSCRTSKEHERRSEELRRRKDRAEEEMREREGMSAKRVGEERIKKEEKKSMLSTRERESTWETKDYAPYSLGFRPT